MKRVSLWLGSVTLLVCVAFIATAAAQDVDKLSAKFPPAKQPVIPEVQKVTLDNGIRLYLLEDHSLPTVQASMRVNCGSYLEPADKIGLAEITGSVMRTGGTQTRTGDDIDKQLESVGGSVETSIGLLFGGGSMFVLTDYTDLGLEILADVLQRPVFEQDKIDLAKMEERSAISRRNDDAEQIGQREFSKAIYGPTSVYARHTEYKTISSITREDLVNFHKQWFHPENVQLAVWGDFDKAAMIEKVKKYFGGWPKGNVTVPPPPTVEYTFPKRVLYVNKTDINQSKIYLGHIGGRQTDPDYADLVVMNSVLGAGSFATRLFQNVRSKEGLAYAVFGVYSAQVAYPGVFYNYASTKSETTAKAVREIIKQIQSMQTDPATPAEMRMAKDGYDNSFVFQFDTKAEVINRLLNYDFYGLPADFNIQLREKIKQTTPQSVMAAAKARLRPDALQVLIVGKTDDFDVPLDQLGLGEVQEIDVTIPSGEEQRELAMTPENLAKGSELLGKTVAAHGGTAAFKKVKSISGKGTFLLNTPQGDFPLDFEEVRVLPNQSRQVISMMGQKMYDVRDQKSGWRSQPGATEPIVKSEEELTKDDEESSRNTINLFRQADKPDYQAVYDGSGDLNGVEVNFVAIVDKNGKQLCRLAINSQTNQLAGKSYIGESPMGEGLIQETYSDVKDIQGVKLPMTIDRVMSGQKVGTVKYSEFQVNAVVSPNIFDKPDKL